MEWLTDILSQYLPILLAIMAGSLILAMILLGWIYWRVRNIDLPPDADFKTALQHTPFVVVLFLDLLDLSLDSFSVPITWVVLSRLGLAPLRGVTALEGVFPGTQFIPVMTLSWLAVRLFGSVLKR
ncbi:MAG: hypothetical protein B6242_09945 [Anaerolineaceae bacterium 4572_78]|nr:MAG: hypothetical protein B6242_09945 [Anaerolineaceae bacterium 4572_78]